MPLHRQVRQVRCSYSLSDFVLAHTHTQQLAHISMCTSTYKRTRITRSHIHARPLARTYEHGTHLRTHMYSQAHIFRRKHAFFSRITHDGNLASSVVHTHTHTHTHTHIKLTHCTGWQPCFERGAHTYTHIHLHKHMNTALTYALEYIYRLTFTDANTRTHTRAHTHTLNSRITQDGNLASSVVPLLSQLGTDLAGVLSDPSSAATLRAEFGEEALLHSGVFL